MYAETYRGGLPEKIGGRSAIDAENAQKHVENRPNPLFMAYKKG
jgi:hypothetical protein